MQQPIWQAASAELYGKIEIAEGVSIWSNVVMRAESSHIEIGAFTNIQDFTMIHIADGPTVIGEYCSITHHCTIHGATIGNNCLIGINATIMDGAVIGDNSIVAGNSLVREGTVIPANSIVAGTPAKVIAQRNNFVANRLNALAYYDNGIAYGLGNHRVWSEDEQQAKMAQRKTDLEKLLAGQ
ncbi:MAG: carbonic anhydrase/acetyltransferase-like protein (isoleucine patch superfamily) [Candidatus Azotimanducaceae bacterium]|jgi:carbonic anhydrase/acetyltransferase-like protein (isoleucine patch superfamily)|tara:strand:- start:363 stop:911 length:549 start_codon:yes stop_codon:yes gene_type:complete